MVSSPYYQDVQVLNWNCEILPWIQRIMNYQDRWHKLPKKRFLLRLCFAKEQAILASSRPEIRK